ncbi:MAG TPA: N,N-dimethylformamidase beta subunit family domain-containing protein [Streptosporangiaceae bacterium]|nr:N,N-dimethylformamidase beta subunit family domain-containing protein [Streptosporangiaceae bacterium]
MTGIPLLGYPSHWSVRAGTAIDFMVSASADSYQAEIVRVTGRGPRPDGDGPPLRCERVPSDVGGSYPGAVHQTVSGSYGVAGHLEPSPAGEGSIAAWVYPTLPAAGRWQSILTWLGPDGRPALVLGVDEAGCLALRYERGDSSGSQGLVTSPQPLTERRWHYVAGSVSPATGRVTLVQQASHGTHRGHDPGQPPIVIESDDETLDAAPLGGRGYVATLGTGPLHPGALTSVAHGSYNGKIDEPQALSRALSGADLLGRAGQRPGDAALAGVAYVNSPVQRATGHRWSGATKDWRVCPAEYGAVWFHDDDLADADWPAAFRWDVPAGTRSGMYAALLTGDAGEQDVISFYVRPGDGEPTAPLAVLVPTFTYTIYSNFYHPARATDGADASQDEIAGAFLGEHREFGLSLYCKHRDGSGVSHVSSLRPMIDMRPWHRIVTRGNAGRELSGDLYLLDWLEHEGIAYDTVTDDDLHAEGADLLRPYAGVVTGGHPEYVSGQMLDAIAEYTGGGGNLAYLGGNGFYWVTTVADGAPHLLEVRRGRSGSRTWTGEPGEGHHATGEPGGHWVDRGRAPQALTGVGFCAQGGGAGAGYRRTAASEDPRASFIFDGIGRDEVIGDFGLKLGGAAGDELDRADPALGTPPQTLVVATSAGAHDDGYQRAVEEVEEMSTRHGGSQDPDVRADMTYLETPGGGSVFSVGSIAWTASLSHAGFSNNVARLTGNVLREFTRRGARAAGERDGSPG